MTTNLADLPQALGPRGITATIDGQHGDLTLTRGSSRQVYLVVHGPGIRLTHAQRTKFDDGGRQILVWTDYVSTKTADNFRRAGFQYVDEVGNMWLEFGDVLIDVRGRRRRTAEGAPRPTRGVANLFSAARARVVFALLAWPDLWSATQREIARTADVSPGQVNDTLKLLRQAGYDWRTSAPGESDLLDHWAAAYPTGLGPTLRLAEFRGDIDVQKLRGDAIQISGEGAVRDLIRPATLTAYVERLEQPTGPSLPILNRWRADATSPNIFVRRKFWHEPNEPDRPLETPQPCPWPIVYADLLATDDPRLRNAAREWREHAA